VNVPPRGQDGEIGAEKGLLVAARGKRQRTKQFPHTATIERRGVALCGSIVSEMGLIWREKGVDVGIDGEIELVDNANVLGRVLWVQSKAQSDANPFPGEDERGFTYTCRQVDVDYWLGGTAPVLLVCSHPESGLAWYKHLPSWFDDPARRRERRVHFDKVSDRFDASAVRKLLDLGVESASGIYLSPPPRHETLVTNLLAVEHLASTVHRAPSTCRGWPDANPRLLKAGVGYLSDVVFRGGEVWSFRRFDEPPLEVLADGTPETVGTDELTASTDAADQTLLRWLMGATLKDLTGKELRQHHERKYLYFKARKDTSEWRVQAGTRRGGGRTVVKRYEPPEGARWSPYTRHLALESQFVQADDRWYLAMVPTYHFTSDGREDSSFSSLLLSTIKQREGHEAIRSQTRFWARYLAGSADLFSGAPDARMRFGTLAEVAVDRGIDDKSWKPLSQDEIELISKDGAPTLFDPGEEN
jgi:hypothetical protein